MIRSIVLATFACCVLLSCNPDRNATPDAPTTERPRSGTVGSTIPDFAPDPPEVTPRQVVAELGRRMKEVSTLAPPDVAAATIRRTYSGLVTAELLDRWTTEPATAPGRQVSSPWPERIDVQNVSEEANGKVVVTGVIVEVTSTGEAARIPVRLTVDRVANGWLLSDYRVETIPSEDATQAVDVLKSYYAAISARDYARAYSHWGPSGPPNQTIKEFARGYANTAKVTLETGNPSRVEPAAGSRYVQIPVTITARTTSGETQRFEGSYSMRRAVVDGASASARRWHIHRAVLRPITQ